MLFYVEPLNLSTQRPVGTRAPLSAGEIVLEILAAGGCVLCVLIVALSWASLPETIPHHIDFSGKPNAWGTKKVLWLLPALALILYAGMTFVSRYPHRFNYLVPITEANAFRQYRIARGLLTWLKAEVVFLFAFLEWAIVRVAWGTTETLGALTIPVILALILATVVVHLVLAYRAR